MDKRLKKSQGVQAYTDSTPPTPTYARNRFITEVDDTQMLQEVQDPRAVQQMIFNRLDLDARNSSDLGSYICDYMDPECDELVKRAIGKVYIDHSEYPQTSYMGDAVAEIIQNWYGGTALTPEERENGQIVGTVTIGSSEAIMLGLMAHQQNWYANYYPTVTDVNGAAYAHDRPLLMFARDVHTCWDKYAQYYNVGMLSFNLSDDNYLIDPDKVDAYLRMSLWDVSELASTGDVQAKQFWDALVQYLRLSDQTAPLKSYLQSRYLHELVCCVGCVIGTTFTGQGDPVEKINAVLANIKKDTGSDIPIHVDAASGGFVVPFTNPDEADFKWNFSLDHVASINVSNHKFGMVYPGCGTVVFRDPTVVSWEDRSYKLQFSETTVTLESLIYHITYLGGNFTDYTVNFSRGSAMVLAAYYNLKRFGLDGYGKIATQCVENTQYLAGKIAAITDSTGASPFTVISDTEHYPMVVWRFADGYEPNWTLTQLSNLLEESGWKLPAYQLPYTSSREPDGPWVMRVVTRQDISANKIDILASNIQDAVNTLDSQSRIAVSDDAKALLAAMQSRVEFKGSGDYR